MKKYIIAMVALLSTFFTTANAMSYEQAREQALFLTDKMAYELNLDEEQYEAAYEVNLDYLLSVNTYDDVFADYWIHRNEDLRYILLDCSASTLAIHIVTTSISVVHISMLHTEEVMAGITMVVVLGIILISLMLIV